jgi:hypothetical protein
MGRSTSGHLPKALLHYNLELAKSLAQNGSFAINNARHPSLWQ